MSVQRQVQDHEPLEEAVERIVRQRLDALIEEKVARALEKDPARNMIRIIASKGTLDFAYPPLILASTGAALGMDAAVFFTFYGLTVLKKANQDRLLVDPVGNPGMPMVMPNIVAMLPGMRHAATAMMKRMFRRHKVPAVGELLELCRESGVRLVACQMTMDVMGIRKEDLIDGLEFSGAAAFLSEARRSHVTLFI